MTISLTFLAAKLQKKYAILAFIMSIIILSIVKSRSYCDTTRKCKVELLLLVSYSTMLYDSLKKRCKYLIASLCVCLKGGGTGISTVWKEDVNTTV